MDGVSASPSSVSSPTASSNYILIEGNITIANLRAIEWSATRCYTPERLASAKEILFSLVRLASTSDLTRERIIHYMSTLAPPVVGEFNNTPEISDFVSGQGKPAAAAGISSKFGKIGSAIPSIAMDMLGMVGSREKCKETMGSVASFTNNFNPFKLTDPVFFYACGRSECRCIIDSPEERKEGDGTDNGKTPYEKLLYYLNYIGHFSKPPTHHHQGTASTDIGRRVSLRDLLLQCIEYSASVRRQSDCTQHAFRTPSLLGPELYVEAAIDPETKVAMTTEFSARMWDEALHERVDALNYTDIGFLLSVYSALFVTPKTSQRAFDVSKNIVQMTGVHLLRRCIDIMFLVETTNKELVENEGYQATTDTKAPGAAINTDDDSDEAMDTSDPQPSPFSVATTESEGFTRFSTIYNLLSTYSFFFGPLLIRRSLCAAPNAEELVKNISRLVTFLPSLRNHIVRDKGQALLDRISDMKKYAIQPSKSILATAELSHMRLKLNTIYYNVLGEVDARNGSPVLPKTFFLTKGKREVAVNALPILQEISPNLSPTYSDQTKIPDAMEIMGGGDKQQQQPGGVCEADVAMLLGDNQTEMEKHAKNFGNFLGWFVGTIHASLRNAKRDIKTNNTGGGGSGGIPTGLRVLKRAIQEVHTNRTLDIDLLKSSVYRSSSNLSQQPNVLARHVKSNQLVSSINWQTINVPFTNLSPLSAIQVELTLANGEENVELMTRYMFYEQVISMKVLSKFYNQITSGDFDADGLAAAAAASSDNGGVSKPNRLEFIKRLFESSHSDVVEEYTREVSCESSNSSAADPSPNTLALEGLYKTIEEIVNVHDESPLALVTFGGELEQYEELISGLLNSIKLLFE